MSFSEWQNVTFGEVCETISETHKVKKGKLIFLNTGDIERGKILHKNYSPVEKMPGQAKKSIKKGDILFSEIRPANGRWAYVDFESEDFIVSTKLMVIRANEKINSRYLYHLLTSPEIVKKLQQLAEARSGTFPQITFTQLSSIEFSLPPKEIQIKISSFFDSLERKIELNYLTNQTLENITQTIFKEMCLPKGSDDHKGWILGKLKDFYKTTSGGTPSRTKLDFYENGSINWVKSKELGDFFVLETEEKITEEALKKSSAKLLPINSILLAMYGATVGEISILGKEASCNQAICAILPNNRVTYSFIYEYLKSQKDNLKNMAIGGAQQNISQQVIQEIELYMPSKDILNSFHQMAEGVYDLARKNIEETTTLNYLRKNLMPKLLKGEIEIKDL